MVGGLLALSGHGRNLLGGMPSSGVTRRSRRSFGPTARPRGGLVPTVALKAKHPADAVEHPELAGTGPLGVRQRGLVVEVLLLVAGKLAHPCSLTPFGGDCVRSVRGLPAEAGGQGMMTRPQQPELRRSQRGRLEQESWRRKAEAEGVPPAEGQTGPVPEGNRPVRTQTWTCTNCGFDVPQGDQRCPRCGSDLPGE